MHGNFTRARGTPRGRKPVTHHSDTDTDGYLTTYGIEIRRSIRLTIIRYDGYLRNVRGMGGANDSKDGNWINRTGQATFQPDTQALYTDFTSLGAKVFAAYPPAVDPISPCCGIHNNVIQYQIPMIQTSANATGAIELDTYALTEPHTTCPGTDCWYVDGVHFNEPGAMGLAEFFADAILAQCHVDGLCGGLPCDCSQYTKRGACQGACGGGVCVWVGSAKRCFPI
jgi:hypothetical protein